MQFYTIPRIIQWFVESDRVKTELLMVCASIFLMIGPCIFYFFVCRREIITMLRDQLSTFKHPNCFEMCHRLFGRSNSYNVEDVSVTNTTQSEIHSSALSIISNSTTAASYSGCI